MDGDAPGMGCTKGLQHKLCLPRQLSERKCEGNGVMEYESRSHFSGAVCIVLPADVEPEFIKPD
ncbi:hypothetical protein D4764_07G0003020 [Takifugu flavidus]|uniref:Uncharacterized protein n=1 Tax=Takifugu flavidus TaxID=433684 RepID=A0A5C6MRP0_9TELE|nr:hypothetical protein D4764_07G0003020 [Takifugu flavidus]